MSFWRNYVHVVWTTKERQSLIGEAIEAHLYAQMVRKASEMDCHVYAINGTSDHIHLVLAIPPKHSVAEVVKMLKGASSHFVNQILRLPDLYFEWQRGYGCFSLGHSQLPRAIAYVEMQKAHHTQKTVNAWLERTAEVDEGPTEMTQATVMPTQGHGLREEGVGYDAFGDMPF